MKKQISIFFISVFTFFGFSIEKETVKSSISEVTVFTQGAQIFRKANYSVKPGITEIIIDGICPTIDPKSLQVKASGNIVLIDSKYSLYYPKPDLTKIVDGLPLKIKQDILKLEDSIYVLTFDIQEVQDEIDVLLASKNILSNNGAIKGHGKVNDSIQLLKQALEYYNLKMNEINKKLLVLNRKKNEKSKRKEEMNLRLNKLKNYQSSVGGNIEEKGPIHRITITVSSKELVSGKISLSYLVSQAGWVPLYDIKSDIYTGKVNLTYKAQVFQNTGINWEDIKLSVSTNNPYLNKTKPTLHPWYLNFQNQYVNTSSPRNYVNQAQSLKRAGKAVEDYPSADSAIDYNASTSANFVNMIDQVISAEFKIDLPYTIISNNEAHMILIKNEDLAANFKYFAVPKIDASVYLVAQISKLDELQLIPAKANIFFDGAYMGETFLNPSNMDDTLSLSLGKDPNIIIKRTLLKKDSKERFIGNQVEKTKSFEIEIKNLKSQSIELVVHDQIPVTQNSDITIELLSKDKANFNPTSGLLEWNLSLKTKENTKLNFSYKVKYNKEMNLVL
jgi:uncharacterized protein (TIGR02231 family)